jgi:hypothetical protein
VIRHFGEAASRDGPLHLGYHPRDGIGDGSASIMGGIDIAKHGAHVSGRHAGGLLSQSSNISNYSSCRLPSKAPWRRNGDE